LIASPTPSPVPTVLTTTCRIAPRRRTEPALPTTSRGEPVRRTSDGAIMLVSRRPGRVRRPDGLRSYSPSMLLRCTPVPGTMTPDPEPFDAVSEAALPRASPHDVL